MFADPSPGWVWLFNGLALTLWHLLLAWASTHAPVTWFARDGWLTRIRLFEREGRVYDRLLRVRVWKPLLPDGGAWFRRGFPKARLDSRSPAYLLRFAAETRRGEWSHWVMLLALPLFGLWNTTEGLLVVTFWLVGSNLPCIIVQRYNRARLLRVMGERERLWYTGGVESQHGAKGAANHEAIRSGEGSELV